MDIDTLAERAGEVPGPTPDQLLAGRRRLDDATQQAATGVVAPRRSRRGRRRWAFTALTGAAAATTAVLAVTFGSAPQASAELILLVTAEAAGQQPDRAAGAAYWYVRSEVDNPQSPPAKREIWLSRSDESVLRDETTARRAPGSGSADPAQVRTQGLDGPATFSAGGDPLSWEELDALPTDPDALEALIRKNVAGHDAGEENQLWESVTGLLRESPASPALRQALWEVAAGMPDVELVGPMTDAAGRRGTGIERDQLDQGWYRVIYILDPGTGALLETKNLDEDGDVDWRQTQLVQEPRDTAPRAQPPLCGPGSVPERSC